MPTTPGGLRYPAASDPPDVPSDMQKLAEDIEADTPAAIASGYAALPSTAAGAVGSLSVSFPAGRFAYGPRVAIASVSGAPNTRIAGSGTATTTSVVLYVYNGGGGAVTPAVYWVAVQDRSQVSLVALEATAGDTFGTFVCTTSGCGNEGEPIEMQTGYTDDDGVDQVVGGHQCGVCGAPMSPA